MLVASFALAVVAFIASTALTAFQLQEVSRRSEVISTTSMPSVLELTMLREQLHRLEDSLEALADSPARSTSSTDVAIDSMRALAAELTSRFTDEEARVRWSAARSSLAEVVRLAARVRDRAQAGDGAGARALMSNEVRPIAASADTEIWRMVQENAIASLRSARSIETIRSRATALSIGLDVTCSVLSALLAILALRAQSRHTQLMEERARDLEAFASRVAHDLRDPLAPALVAIERAMARTPEGDPMRPGLERGQRSLARMTALIDDLLAFARSGRPRDGNARAALRSAVEAVLEQERDFAESRRVELRGETDGEFQVACSSAVLTSVLTNLVHNAIKYIGPSAERRVAVRARREADDVLVEVEDTGPGLPVSEHARIFDPYVRADRTGQPGLGLGLATVKRLVQGHGGSVGVRSTSGGCTFWIKLPSAQHEAA